MQNQNQISVKECFSTKFSPLDLLVLSTSYLNIIEKSVSNTNLSKAIQEKAFNRAVFSMESLNSEKSSIINPFESDFISAELSYKYIDSKENFSEESFESTDESDANLDSNDCTGLSKPDVFYSGEVVWAKRTLLPWFPAIIINPNESTKETQDIIKKIGSKLPTQEKLSLENRDIEHSEAYHLVLFFNKKKTWMYLTENKLRPFCKENDDLFLKKADYFSSRYRKQLKKSYEKAKKFAYKPVVNNHHHHHTIQHLLNQLFHL